MNFKFSFKFIRSVVGTRTTGMIGARPPSRLPHETPLSSALRFNVRFTASFHCLSSKERSPQVTANVYAEAKRKGRKTSNSKAALNGKQTREELDQQWLLSLSPMVESPTVTSPQEILQRNERMWILGIDPDVGGAIALLKPSSDGSPSDAHVVIDNGCAYKATGRLLMHHYPHLLWTPCVAHCIDLLKDLAKLPSIQKVGRRAKLVSKFVYTYSHLHQLFH